MNTHNPFAPPSSDLNAAPETLVIPRKPISVWVVQIIGSLAAAWGTFGLIMIFRGAMAGLTVTGFGIPVSVHLLLQSCFIAFLLLMLWKLPGRSRLSRYLGLGLIGFFILLMSFAIIKSFWSGPIEATMIVTGIVLAPFIYWAYAFAFSRKALQYFEVPDHG